MVKSKKFTPSELVQPSLLKVVKPDVALDLIGQVVIDNLDNLRIDYESMVRALGLYKKPQDVWFTINGEYHGQTFIHSGVRSADCPEGAPNSTHKDWNTFDIKCAHLDVLLAIVTTYYSKYQIKRIENPKVTVPRGWMHIEFSEYMVTALKIFNP